MPATVTVRLTHLLRPSYWQKQNMHCGLDQLKACLPTAAFAFGGYELSNLGRTHELLAHPVYGPLVRGDLDQASRIYTESIGRPIDLATRVAARRDTSWETYAEAVVLVLATHGAQLRLLRECFGIDYRSAALAYGHSLGELGALVASAVFRLDDLLLEEEVPH